MAKSKKGGQTSSPYEKINTARTGRPGTQTGADYSRGSGRRDADDGRKLTRQQKWQAIKKEILNGIGFDDETLEDIRKRRAQKRSDKLFGSKETKRRGGKGKVTSIEKARRAKAKNTTRGKALSILKYVALGLLAVYFIYQVYFMFYAHVDTEMIMTATVEDAITDVTGIAIRDERIITTDQSGVIVSAVESGGKVSKGQTVARVFESADAAQAYQRINEIDELLSRFEDMKGASEDVVYGSATGRNPVEESLLEMAKYIYSGNLGKAEDKSDDVLYQLNRQQISTKLVENFDGRVSELKEERKQLAAQYNSVPASLVSPQAGYYISCVDGYEDVLSTSELDGLTPQKLDELMKQRRNSESEWVVGKIADNYTWYIACEVTNEQAARLEENKSYTLRLPYCEIESITARLKNINLSDDVERVMLIFECTNLVSELSEMRAQPITIVLSSFTGLEVDKSYLVDYPVESPSDVEEKTPDSEKKDDEPHGEIRGVYILWGNKAKLRKVEVMSEAGDKVFCKQEQIGSGWLKLYDEVITKTKGMYDGKIINGNGNAK